MAPMDSKLTGFISNLKNQFQPIRVKLNNRWVTKFQCVYPGCSKRKLQHEELQTQRLETTYIQLYVHAMRFHKSSRSRIEKLTKAEMEIGLRAAGPNNIGIPIKDNLEKSENESTRGSTTAFNFKPQGLKALNDWRDLM